MQYLIPLKYLFNKNTLITKAKKNKNSVLLSRYYRSVKTLLSFWDSNMDKDHAKQGEKEQTNKQFTNLPIRTVFTETNTNARAEKCFKIKKFSSRLNENMNIVEFFKIELLVHLFITEFVSLQSKDKKKFSKAQQLCDNMLIGQEEESKITLKN